MIKRLLGRLLPLALIKRKLGFPSQELSLEKLRARGFVPRHILDIGAYEGNWCEMVRTIFPEAAVLMIEGQTGKQAPLEAVVARYPNSSFRIALLGSERKEVTFNVYETASSVLSEDNETPARIETRWLERLDDVVAGTPFAAADLLKIDCQGYELEILKGGLATLRAAQAVLLEVSFLPIYVNCPLAHEVIALMKQEGFVIYDICTLLPRPYDRALYQADMLFVKEDSFLRASTRWA